MGKKHIFEKCNKCKYNNDVTGAISNEDYDKDELRQGVGYIYCLQCGQQIEIKLKN